MNIRAVIVVGGRWHAFDLARGLQERGALLRIVTNYPPSRLGRWGISRERCVFLPLSLVLDQFRQRCLPVSWSHRFQGLAHSFFERRAAAYVEGADVVHGWSSYARLSFRKARKRNARLVLERGSSHIKVQCRLLDEERGRTGVALGFTHDRVVACELEEYEEADVVQVPSSFVEDSFLEQGFPAKRLFKNLLGVNLREFSPSASPPQPVPFRVVFAGGLSFRKGIHDLVAGFTQAGVPGAELILLGSPSAETVRLIGSRFPGLHLLGHRPQSELAEHYRRSHIFVHASIEEGMAMVQAQALACGLPLVCTRHTGGEDLLRSIAKGKPPIDEGDGVTRYTSGFVVPIRSPSILARCIRRLHEDHKLREAMAEAARSIRFMPLDWQAYADRTLALYERLLRARQ